MADYFMKGIDITKKRWWLAGYIYLAPLVASVFLIWNSGHLLGDFTHVDIDHNGFRLLFTAITYITPLIVIIFALKCGKRLDNLFHNKGNERILFNILIMVAIFTLLFGGITVGRAPSPGLTGIVQTLIAKLNPYLLFLILVALHPSPYKLLIGLLCVMLMGFAQKSFLGLFVTLMGVSIYWIDMRARRGWQIIIFFGLIILIVASAGDFITLIYDIRNQVRGRNVTVPTELILSYALGRINSFSSLYQVFYDNCCYNAPPSIFFSLGTFLERLIGLKLIANATPGEVYNRFILGDGVGYAIFTSMMGSAFIVLKNSWFSLVANTLTFLFFLKFMYLMIPIPNGASKLPLFLIILYLPYLSGDVWELSLQFQTVLLLRGLIFFFDRVSFGLKQHKFLRLNPSNCSSKT